MPEEMGEAEHGAAEEGGKPPAGGRDARPASHREDHCYDPGRWLVTLPGEATPYDCTGRGADGAPARQESYRYSRRQTARRPSRIEAWRLVTARPLHAAEVLGSPPHGGCGAAVLNRRLREVVITIWPPLAECPAHPDWPGTDRFIAEFSPDSLRIRLTAAENPEEDETRDSPAAETEEELTADGRRAVKNHRRSAAVVMAQCQMAARRSGIGREELIVRMMLDQGGWFREAALRWIPENGNRPVGTGNRAAGCGLEVRDVLPGRHREN